MTCFMVVSPSCASAQESTTDRTPQSASQRISRVRIPTYLAESITKKAVLPRDIGISGDVVLEVLVEKNGRVMTVRGVSGDPRLVRAAKPAVMKWVFTPWLLDGEPVQFLTELTIQFDGRKESAKLKLESDPLSSFGSSKQSDVAKNKHFAPQSLELVETITISTELASNFAAPFRCDSDGNLYVMPSFGDGDTGIRKLNKKGELQALLRASTATDPAIEVATYFSLGPDGTVYQLGFPHMFKRYIVAFGKDGSVKSEIGLETPFKWGPSLMMPFASGDFLVTGLKYNPEGPDLPRLPFTGIFSSSGVLLKEISLKDDKNIADMGASGDDRVVPAGSPLANLAVENGAMESAPDGNIYLMRNLSPAIVYAISPGGAVVKRFEVKPDEGHYRPFIMHISGGRIAVLFREAQTHKQLVKVVDLDGHEMGTYSDEVVSGQSRLGLAFACYTDNPERLTFLGTTDDNKLQFKIAEPR